MKLIKFAPKPLSRSSILAAGAVVCQLLFIAGAEAKMPTAKIGNDNVVTLEVASTEHEIEHGLMERTSLPEDQGMIFLFRPARAVNFWMYNCYISLDMLFIRDGKIEHIFEDVPPCRSKDPSKCPTYPEGQGMLVSEVIELKGGYAKRHNVKIGDKVTFDVVTRPEPKSEPAK